MPREDPEILRECQAGSQEAFRELVERYQQRVFWTAKNVVNSRDLAQDITQEAFVRIYQAIKTVDPTRKFFPFLYQVVVNLCIDHLRKEGSTRKVSIDEIDDVGHKGPGPTEHAEGRELKDLVQAVLARLPAKYRMVITLRDIQGYTCEEISDMLKINSSTLRWRLHMARKYFKEIWESAPRPSIS